MKDENKSFLKAIWAALLCWLFFVSPARAEQYRFDSWTTDNGLPQNSVISVLQTRDGYLWLTTFDGLVRSDGVRFTVFNKSNTANLSSNRFTRLFESADGALWAGTEDGGLIRYKNGEFASFTTAEGLSGNQVTWIYGDRENRLLIETSSGVRYFDGERFSVVPEQAMFNQPKIYLAPSGNLWLIEENGLHRIEAGARSDFSFPAELPGLNLIESSSPFENRNGNLWIPTRQGLLVFENGRFRLFEQAEQIAPEAFKNVRAIFEDKDGSMWFAAKTGLLVFRNGKFQLITAADGLPEAEIRSISQDREGTIWLGTSASGLIKMTRQFISSLSTRKGLPHKNIYPVFESKRGEIWLGSLPGLSRFSGGRFEPVPLGRTDDRDALKRKLFYPAPENSPVNVTSIGEDGGGRLWIGTIDGLGAFENGNFTDYTSLVTFTDDAGLVKRSTVWAIYEDRVGRLWFGTEKGLFRLENGQLTRFSKRDGLPGDDVKVILQSRDGAIWLGTYGGLVKLEREKERRGERELSGSVVNSPSPLPPFSPTVFTTADGLASNRVRALYEDSEGTLWIGTYDGGLARFKNGKFTSFTPRDGLFNHGVFQILEDDAGNFWMSSNNGIFRASKQQLNDFAEGEISRIESIGYGKADGMLNAECNGGSQPAGIKARDRRLWFPTQDGVAVIDPKNAPFNPNPPPVVIESVTVERQKAAFKNPLEINPNQNNLEIAYTGLSFIKPEQVRFRYRLEGLDAEWIEAGTRRTAYYSYLPPGDYEFRVVAANSDGVWNERGASFRVKVLPPFYRTWWFSAVVLGVAGLLIFMAFRVRVRQLTRARIAQEEFSRKLLASQERERQRIAAELHDSIGQSLLIIKNRAFLALSDLAEPDAVREQLEELTESAAGAIEECREIAYNLRPYQIERFGLTRTLEAIFRRISEVSEIETEAETDSIDDLFSREAQTNIYRVVQESVNNIIKHSGARRAVLKIKRRESEIEIFIFDDGRGFDPDKPKSNGRGGFGLIGMAERVRMLGGVYEIVSDFERGTKIKIKIPFSQ